MRIKIKSIREADNLAGKKIFLRADFNIPLKVKKNKTIIKDDYKIIRGLQTIRFLLRYKCRIIIATHLGNPKNRSKRYSTKPIAKQLEKLLGIKVNFVNDCIGFKVGTVAGKMKERSIVLLENLRFYSGEKANDKKFARELAKLADIYINNAFAVSHRKHASVVAIKKFLPSYAGFLLEEEVVNLSRVLSPQKPLVVVMGGAKISTKINLLNKLYSKAFRVLVGGALANNFLLAHNFNIGQSLIDEESLELAKKLKRRRKILIPFDVVVRNKKDNKVKIKSIKDLSNNDIIFDIGPKTINLYSTIIRQAKTIIWNGPMGMFESPKFKYGTLSIAEKISCAAQHQAFAIAGGGETVESLKKSGLINLLDWVSTGGGAMLAFLGKEKMPGLDRIVKLS